MLVFNKLCRTAGCLRVHRTESVSVMGRARSAAVRSLCITRRSVCTRCSAITERPRCRVH